MSSDVADAYKERLRSAAERDILEVESGTDRPYLGHSVAAGTAHGNARPHVNADDRKRE